MRVPLIRMITSLYHYHDFAIRINYNRIFPVPIIRTLEDFGLVSVRRYMPAISSKRNTFIVLTILDLCFQGNVMKLWIRLVAHYTDKPGFYDAIAIDGLCHGRYHRLS